MSDERKNILLKLKEQLDGIERDTKYHGYKIDSEYIGFGSILNVLLLNSIVHKELGLEYESWYLYDEDFNLDLF